MGQYRYKKYLRNSVNIIHRANTKESVYLFYEGNDDYRYRPGYDE